MLSIRHCLLAVLIGNHPMGHGWVVRQVTTSCGSLIPLASRGMRHGRSSSAPRPYLACRHCRISFQAAETAPPTGHRGRHGLQTVTTLSLASQRHPAVMGWPHSMSQLLLRMAGPVPVHSQSQQARRRQRWRRRLRNQLRLLERHLHNCRRRRRRLVCRPICKASKSTPPKRSTRRLLSKWKLWRRRRPRRRRRHHLLPAAARCKWHVARVTYRSGALATCQLHWKLRE